MLEGALALAVPTVFGQSLSIQPISTAALKWKSKDDKANTWFENTFIYPELEPHHTSRIAVLLVQVLEQAKKKNPLFLASTGFAVTTQLDFPRDWGLGSSSTLINNIAQWAGVDAYQLLWNTLGGSGYDIACAQHNTPIHYQLVGGQPKISTVNFNPTFKDQLYFVHLNQKQSSTKEILGFKKRALKHELEKQEISEISKLLGRVNAIDDFEKLLKEHEHIMRIVLQKDTIQQSLFKDYFGQIKSLGAWGGDFILATGNADTPSYFIKKGYKTVLLYDEMVLKND